MRLILFFFLFLILYFLFRSLKRMFLSGRRKDSSAANIFSKPKSKIDKQNVIDVDYEDVTDKNKDSKN